MGEEAMALTVGLPMAEVAPEFIKARVAAAGVDTAAADSGAVVVAEHGEEDADIY